MVVVLVVVILMFIVLMFVVLWLMLVFVVVVLVVVVLVVLEVDCYGWFVLVGVVCWVSVWIWWWYVGWCDIYGYCWVDVDFCLGYG